MTTVEYLKQKGYELLNLLAIKPTLKDKDIVRNSPNNPQTLETLPASNFTNEQIVELIDKDLRNDNAIDDNGKKLTALIGALPEEFKNKDLVSELHKKYDNTVFSGELAYSLVILDLEKNNKNAIEAIEHFRSNRFITNYDPVGADDSFGQICGCDYYINRAMTNPADKFDPNLLTIKQWHDIASQEIRMIEFIPEAIIKNETFWNNYQDFIGKGKYLNHPKYEYCIDNYDEYEVFSKMPEKLKTDPKIISELLSRNAISMYFVSEPTEEHYLLINPKDYYMIPMKYREKDNFKEIAQSAFNIDNWNIAEIPAKFITKEMVSTALSYNMEICSSIPKPFLNEDLLIDKIKNYKDQGYFKDLKDSREGFEFIDYETKAHNKVLQYIPEELKTDRICREALKANPENEAFLPTKLKVMQRKDGTAFKAPVVRDAKEGQFGFADLKKKETIAPTIPTPSPTKEKKGRKI